MGQLFIEDLVASGEFVSVIFSCDGTNANRAAIRMITRELQNYDKLLLFTIICNAHGVNNAGRCGLGNYTYGEILRRSHVFDAARDRKIPTLVDRALRDTTNCPIGDKCVGGHTGPGIPGEAPVPLLAGDGEVGRKSFLQHLP